MPRNSIQKRHLRQRENRKKGKLERRRLRVEQEAADIQTLEEGETLQNLARAIDPVVMMTEAWLPWFPEILGELETLMACFGSGKYSDEELWVRCDWAIQFAMERYATKMSLRALCRSTIRTNNIDIKPLPRILRIFCMIFTSPVAPEDNQNRRRRFRGPRFTF